MNMEYQLPAGAAALATAVLTGVLEDDREELPIARGFAEVALAPRQIATVRLVRAG